MGGTETCIATDSGFSIANQTSSSTNPLAKLTLSNGEEIWDLVGNLAEWVDWDTTGTFTDIPVAEKAFAIGTGANYDNRIELNTFTDNVSLGDTMFPNSWQPANPAYTTAQGMGDYRERSGYPGGTSVTAAASRGSGRQEIHAPTSSKGIYAINLSVASNQSRQLWMIPMVASGFDKTTSGFRCVYRP